MTIYVASSWRNTRHAELIEMLRATGYDVYDFRNPGPGDHGFHWSEIDPGWEDWTSVEFAGALDHPLAQRGYQTDMAALASSDAVVLLLPCGRSAHLEAGWAAGRGKRVAVYLSGTDEPELMYKMADAVCPSYDDLLGALVEWAELLEAGR